MRVIAGTTVLVVCVLVGLVARPLAQGQGQAQGQPPGQARQGGAPGAAPRNIQVLPKDWSSQQVQQFMRTYFTTGLGVQCANCHVTDRSLDDKKEKQTARKMLQMVMAINDQLLKDVGEPPAAGALKVTCYTCHRGTTKPLNAAPAGGGGLSPLAERRD
jgi:hypothetical protein